MYVFASYNMQKFIDCNQSDYGLKLFFRVIQAGFIPISDIEHSSTPSSPAPFIFITDYNTSPWSDVSEEYAINDEEFLVCTDLCLPIIKWYFTMVIHTENRYV